MSFADYSARKTARALGAAIQPLVTTSTGALAQSLRTVGNDWTRAQYDGGFHLFEPPPHAPAISLVFVQSRDGNTGADNPASLGAGDTDAHLIYEGLSRVAADAVLAGAGTVGRDAFFSVWHPELVRLRAALGLPRHPAQVVVTNRGTIDLDGTRLFNVPDARVFVILGAAARTRLAAGLARRPWITPVPMPGDDLAAPVAALRRAHGIARVSAIGGRTTASRLIDAGLVQDLCLTTSARAGGYPGTPFYIGRRALRFDLIVRKEGVGMTLDHLAFGDRRSIQGADEAPEGASTA